MRDEISIFFENPATDPLGKENVEGQIVFDHEAVTIRFKQKDRAFRKNEPGVIRLEYSEIDSVTYTSGLFVSPKVTLRTRDTNKLDEFPGADVAKAVFQVLKESRKQAGRLAEFVEYRQSEIYLEEQNERLEERRSSI